MAIPLYLAQTKAEFKSSAPSPSHLAWMACHFSPYGTGLTNLPKTLPEGSLLILNDRTPVCGHDATLICQTLYQTYTQLQCCGILLDFQRPDCPETAKIAAKIAELSCPVAVSEAYAKPLPCSVFLSTPPPYRLPAEHIAPWKDREIWLDAAMEYMQIDVTQTGSTIAELPYCDPPDDTHYDEKLYCHYHVNLTENCAQFHLWRTKADLEQFLLEAQSLGIKKAIGLYQQLR